MALVIGGTFQDGSAAMVAGGTSQLVFAANPNRQFLLIQNISAEDMWVNFGVAAVADKPSIKVAAGASMQFPVANVIPTDTVNIVSATTGSKYVAKQV